MVNESEILKAIGEILDKGETPTYESILKITGGSKREIAKTLKPWREEKESQMEKKIAPFVDQYMGLDSMEKKAFLYQAGLMEVPPSESKRREEILKKDRRNSV